MAGEIERPHTLLTHDEKEKIRSKIKSIEERAHTKIILHVARHHKGDLYQAALSEFSKQNLHHEKIKTGILLFISLKNRQFQILGDQHIHEKINDSGWRKLADDLSSFFKEKKFYEGLIHFLDSIEKPLCQHFQKSR